MQKVPFRNISFVSMLKRHFLNVNNGILTSTVKTVPKCYYFLVGTITLLRFCIVMHMHKALFTCHDIFMKLITKIKTEKEPTDSHRAFKMQINVRLTL